MKKKIALIALIIFSILMVRFIMLGQKSQEMEMNLGVVEEALTPCDKPSHCFETKDFDQSDIASSYKGPSGKEALKSKAASLGLELVTEKENYLHFIHKSSLFGFTDDIEILYHASGELHFRSGSRVGHSDLGANEKRIRTLFSAP